MKKAVFILNPKAGVRSKLNYEKIIDQFITDFDYSIVYTEHIGHATELAHKAVEDKIELVVGIGGDGTINEIANALVHTETVLGIVPVGSGNGLARHLALPLNPKEALKRINRFKVTVMDTGLFNDRLFLCTAGVGFEGEVSKLFAKSKKRGFVNYSKIVFKSFAAFKPFGTNFNEELLTFCIANTAQYGNNTYIAPQASIQDGKLDIISLDKFNPLSLPHVAWQLFRQKIDRNQKHSHRQTEKIGLSFTRPLPAHIDGEYIGEVDRIQATVQSDSLKIVV